MLKKFENMIWTSIKKIIANRRADAKIEKIKREKEEQEKIQQQAILEFKKELSKEMVFYGNNVDFQENDSKFDDFINNIQEEKKAYEKQATSANLENDNSNIQSSYLNQLGRNDSEVYNYNKAMINFEYFTARCSDGQILTLMPYVIDRWLKSNVLLSNIAEIPVSDAFAGLCIESTDPRLMQELDNINSFLTRQLQDIIAMAVESELYGASYCLLTGDDGSLKQELSTTKNQNLITLRKYSWDVVVNSNKGVADMKERPLKKYKDNDYLQIYSAPVHKSRMILFCGSNVVKGHYYQSILHGYSYSIFENLRTCLFGINYAIEAVLDGIQKRSFDVMAIKGLADKMANFDEKVKQSVLGAMKMMLDKAKTDNVLITDENTQYQRTSNNINLAQDMEGIAMLLCLFTGIPASRLLCKDGGNNGMQGVGVNANERQYQCKLNKLQQHYYKPLHALISKIICMIYGFDDVDFTLSFEPKVEVNEAQKLSNETQAVNNINALVQAGVLSIEEARQKLRALGYLQEVEQQEAQDEKEEQEAVEQL